MKKSLIILLCILAVACTSTKKESESVNEKSDLIGTWANISLLVTMKRLEKNDSLLHAKEGEWESTLEIKPIETTFNSDSTFSSEYFSLDGQNFHTALGKWWIENDSLAMLTEDGLTKYYFEIKDDRVRFRATLDWDGDGEVDDEYDGVQVKIK